MSGTTSHTLVSGCLRLYQTLVSGQRRSCHSEDEAASKFGTKEHRGSAGSQKGYGRNGMQEYRTLIDLWIAEEYDQWRETAGRG